MQDSRQETPWKQITLFLLTLGVLALCALLLHPFFSAIVGAIVLAVITRRPYDWLASKIKNRSNCAAVALVLVILAVGKDVWTGSDAGEMSVVVIIIKTPWGWSWK